ncbi:MAG TPA: hypothetical protein VIF64_03270 [Pyrinomonadaceae bacterium]
MTMPVAPEDPVGFTSLIVCLILLLIFGLAASCEAQDEPDFVPNPGTAKLRVATDEWLVWERMNVTDPRSHLPRCTYSYYLQKNVGEVAQLVYQYSGTAYESERVRGVLKDGTLVMEKVETSLFFVNRDGIKTPVSGFPIRLGKDLAEVLAVYDDGVLVRAGDPNNYKPVYFIPWLANSLDLQKMFMVSDETGTKAGFTTQVFRKGNLLALSGARLLIFDLSNRTHEYFSFGSLPRWFPAIHAFDGETVVFGTGYYGCVIGSNYDCYTKPGFNIKTGRQFLGVVAGSTIAVKNRIAYVIQESSCDKGDCAVQLTAHDLYSTNDQKRTLIDLSGIKPTEVAYVAREDALTVWTGQQWKRIEWLPESQSRN